MTFSAPLPGATLLSGFGPRGRRFHEGLDLAISRRGGEPVRAAADGEVSDVRVVRGYGRMVLIRHADGSRTRYAHLRKWAVKKGQSVDRGEVVGWVGQTGRATRPHLHFEILTRTGVPVDPAPILSTHRN